MKLSDAVDRFYHEMTVSELRLMNSGTDSSEITYNSLLYLDLISYNENCTASYLAATLGVSKPAVTAKLAELIRQGHVVKIQSTEDKRVNYLSVNEDSVNKYMKYDKIMANAIVDIESRYSSDELDIFSKILVDLSVIYNAEQQKETEKK